MLLIFFYCLLDASGLVEEGEGSDHEKMSIVKILTIVIFGEWETLKRKGKVHLQVKSCYWFYSAKSSLNFCFKRSSIFF